MLKLKFNAAQSSRCLFQSLKLKIYFSHYLSHDISNVWGNQLDIFSLPFFLHTCFFVTPLLPFSFLSFFIFWILSLSLNFVVTTRHLNCQTFETRPCLNLALCQLWQHSRKVSMLASDQRLVNRLHCCWPGRWFYWNTEKNNGLKNFEGNYN